MDWIWPESCCIWASFWRLKRAREGGGVICGVCGALAAGDGDESRRSCPCGCCVSTRAMIISTCSSTIWTTSASTLLHSSSPLGIGASRPIRPFFGICLLERSPAVTSLLLAAQAQLGCKSEKRISRDIKLCFLAMAEVTDCYRCDGGRQVEMEIIFQPEE